jgi:hypothetical protein
MSSINDINNYLLDSSIFNNQQSNSDPLPSPQASGTQASTGTQAAAGASPSDIVTLSSTASQMENETLLGLQNQDSSGSGNPLYDALFGSQGSDNSDDLMSSILLSDENLKLMQADPTLMKNILSAEEAQSTDNTSTSDGTASSQGISPQVLQNIENLNLATMDPETLLSLRQDQTEPVDSQPQSATGSRLDTTA